MSENKRKIVIIGGGITGLTVAYYLQKEIHKQQLAIECTLLEASTRLGGKVQTYTENGFVVERGPDSFLARKQSASRLVNEVGMSDALISNRTGKSYVLVKDRLHLMPGGSIMGIPTKMTPFAFSGLFSPLGKLRAGADFILPRSKETSDQSLGHFFRRRLGNEVVDHLIEPLLSGIYAGDIDELSLQATFPQFQQVEEKYRSLILGMKRGIPKPVSSQKMQVGDKGMFLTVSTGLESLVHEVEKHLDQGTVQLQTSVEKIHKNDSHYTLMLNNGDELTADAVIVTTPHRQTAKMFSKYQFFESFKQMPSTSVATVAMAFPESAIKKDIDGTGFVVSRKSEYTITACTWTHKKWSHTTPPGKVLIRCYVGRAGDESIVQRSDEDIKKVVLKDLNKILSLTDEPEFTVITRWQNAMPQYTVGHKQRLKEVHENIERNLPGVFLSGASYEGLGLPDCIDQGEQSVRKVLKFINKKVEA
ncbi:protoporphyrinogen oxidase [Bacillus solimangrovi]|uniref:Coproporphyrinogen III oxidase n=1 Tax=Bacillus solimangrovi TaxID=1305675 RepID=A0A1E5LE88_9BACI|nr:protoporphyrinogen oxidase [Bacillus solimangrovi]OEH92405.1 protoporphyrinogen oxidase [Bacillus solimangrovi]